MEVLAAPVILGKEFLACHSSVLLEYGGPRDLLKIPMNPSRNLENKDATNYSRCFVSTIKKEAPSLFLLCIQMLSQWPVLLEDTNLKIRFSLRMK